MHGGDSLFGRMTSTAHVYRDSGVDAELDHKAHKVTEKLSESINTIANEPSVAFYRIQEHVRKTLPQLVEQKHEVEEVQQLVQGACFDTEYAGNAVKGMQKSVVHFQNIQELLKNAMFMKQQIDYEEARRRQSRAVGGSVKEEGQSGSKGEEGADNMEDSAVSTDSSLAASAHTNTETDGDAAAMETAEQPRGRDDGLPGKDTAEKTSTQGNINTMEREGKLEEIDEAEKEDAPEEIDTADSQEPGETDTGEEKWKGKETQEQEQMQNRPTVDNPASNTFTTQSSP